MKNMTRLLSLSVLCCALAAGTAAKADVYFRDGDRVVLHDYVTTTTTTTHETPDDTVSFYSPGTVIPETVTYTELPSTVTEKLVPAPSGDTYVTIGGNAYLIDRDKRVVVDSERIDQ